MEYYFKPKLVLQVLSRAPSIALDLNGQFVFTAGGTAGAYGISMQDLDTSHLRCVAALLNSRVVDFQVKQISSVFGGRFYSYGDQFIDQIVLPIHNTKFSLAAPLAHQLSSLTDLHHQMKKKLNNFPDSFASDLSKYELDTVKHLCHKQPQAENLKIVPDAIRIGASLYGFEVHYGDQTAFEFETIEHAQCLAEALRNQTRQRIQKKQVLTWRLPANENRCRELLELLSNAHAELARLQDDVTAEETNLNDLIYQIYGVEKKEQQIIEDFLTRYSSGSSGAASAEENGEQF